MDPPKNGARDAVVDAPPDDALVEGLAVRSVHDVHEPVDPRLSLASRPGSDELDVSYSRQLSDYMRHEHTHHHDAPAPDESEKGDATIRVEEPSYVEFTEGDKRNPVNFSHRKKWVITLTACVCTLLASCTASSYNMGFESMIRDLNCTNFQATLGLSLYALGFGIVPLVTASFSEEFGRQPLYVGSMVGFLLMHLMIALSKNIQTVIIARFLQGAFGSTGATMVGGTIADVWMPHERGLPMSIFAVAALGGTGLGPVAAGWVEMNPRLQWRWIQWIHLIITGIFLVLLPILLKETRSSILLVRLAKKIRKDTGDHRYRARAEDEEAKLSTLIYISCTRPILLLFTEPTVSSFSLWIGFAWGIFYCLIESIGPVFDNLHHFSIGAEGTVFITMFIGSLFGFCSNMVQERMYQRYFPTRGPEARLYFACGAAVLLPVGMLIYAWTSFPRVPWIAQVIGITLYIWATFIIYLAVFTYLADCYGPFASSALAGQSLCRNVMGAAFPLFTAPMFARLTYKWANTLFALLAVLMVPIPFVLFFYGPAIRARSKFSRAILEAMPAKG